MGDTTGRRTPTRRVLKQNKSATVDLGMLRRTSSSPEIAEPVKEKRGKCILPLSNFSMQYIFRENDSQKSQNENGLSGSEQI